MSAGATLGWGVFTTVGIREGSPRFLQRHFERLRRDASEAQIELNVSFEAIEEGVHQVLRAQGMKNGLARLTLTQRGDGRWNGESGSDLSVAAVESEVSGAPLGVQLSPYRVEAHRPLVGVKTTSYLPYLWAWKEARRWGFDEAILRDGLDCLSEGARSSLFWMKEGQLFTPSLRTGCLRGIGRDLMMEWGQASSIPVIEGKFLSAQVESADAVWLISAAAGPRRVGRWHDESGTLICKFEEPGEWNQRLLEWWDTLA